MPEQNPDLPSIFANNRFQSELALAAVLASSAPGARDALVVCCRAFISWIIAPRDDEFIRRQTLLTFNNRIHEIDEPQPPLEIYGDLSYDEIRRSVAALNRTIDEHAWLFYGYQFMGGDPALFAAQSVLHPSRALEIEVGRVKRLALVLNVAHFHDGLSASDSATYGRRASAANARKIVAAKYKDLGGPTRIETSTSRVKRGTATSVGTLDRQWQERLDSLAWIYAAFSMKGRGASTLIDKMANKSLWPSVTHVIPQLAGRARFVQESIFPRISWRQGSGRPTSFQFPDGLMAEPFDAPQLPKEWGDIQGALRFRHKPQA